MKIRVEPKTGKVRTVSVKETDVKTAIQKAILDLGLRLQDVKQATQVGK